MYEYNELINQVEANKCLLSEGILYAKNYYFPSKYLADN